jgi:hypothetical protein
MLPDKIIAHTRLNLMNKSVSKKKHLENDYFAIFEFKSHGTYVNV